jgi:two-component system, LytTR family, response regulator
MRCLIVDDEKQSRNTLIDEIHSLQAGYEIVGQADSIVTAIQSIQSLKPDIVFLDIELGDGNGFDVIDSIKENICKIIFVTAFNQYALRAFRISAIDYLLKPINSIHLSDALKKASIDMQPRLGVLKEQFASTILEDKRIAFATTDGFSLHFIKDIIYCQSENNYCHVYFTNQEPLFISKTLKELEELLHDFGFERIHQSYLINLVFLKKYINKDGGYVLLKDGTQLSVSQRKKPQFLERLNHFLSIS